MKKLIGTVVVAALVATAAFAEISFGDWGRALWTISGAYDTGADKARVASDLHQSWAWGTGNTNGASPRVGFTFSADSDNIGIVTQIFWNGDSAISAGDWNAGVYVKPIEWLKITMAGGSDDGTLRSDICLPLWGWDRIGIVKSLDHPEEEGWIFPKLLAKNLSIIATPIEGLVIAGAMSVPTGYKGNSVTADDNENLIVQLGRKSAFAVAYTIDGVGTIKAGVHGEGKGANKDGEEKDRIEINAAFELTAVEGLYVALGGFIPVGGTYSGGVNKNPIHVNLGLSIDMIENLSIQLRGGVAINSADGPANEKDGKLGFLAEAAVTYGFGEGFSVFADIGYANQAWTQTKDGTLTFGVGLDKGFSNGTFGFAFEGTTKADGKLVRYGGKDADAFAWCVPIRIQHWF